MVIVARKTVIWIVITACLIGLFLLLRNCESFQNPLKNLLGFKSDTTLKIVYKDTLIAITPFKIDTLRAVRIVIIPKEISKIDSEAIKTLIYEQDSLRKVLFKKNVKENAICDTISRTKDSLLWTHLHIEYDELQRNFHGFLFEIKPIRATIRQPTITITNSSLFSLGIGGGFGFNSDLTFQNWRPGWNLSLNISYKIMGK